MWDPLSVFFCMWILNAGLPEARLRVSDVIQANEQRVITETICKSVTIREI